MFVVNSMIQVQLCPTYAEGKGGSCMRVALMSEST